MDKELKRAIQLIFSLLLGSRNPAIIPYTPSKTSVPLASSRYFKRTAPYKKGISVGRVQNFLAELEANPACRIHSLMILKDGEVICEAYAPGYERGLVHLSHSMSKTVTGIAVSMLADEERLSAETSVGEVFTEFDLPASIAAISVSDLLRMSSGMSFSEFGAVTSDSWTEDFFSSDQSFYPSEGYSYNSMNSYILARMVEHLSGERFEDFIRARLFSPLKISNYLWEKGPEGTEKGGWGLYLSLEDWLKIASVFIDGGKFEGTQIISHMSMLTLLFDKNEHSASDNENFDYAGHLNIAKKSSALLFNGMFGQNIYIDTSLRLAVAVNSGNNELFKSSATLDTILKYFPADMNDKRLGRIASWRAGHALLKQEKHFFETRTFARARKNRGFLEELHLRTHEFPEEWSGLLGKYLFPMNNAELLPIVVRVIQNNLEGGIDTVEFLRVGNLPHIRLTLGDTVRDIPIGIYSHEEAVLDFYGEKYRIRTIGEAEVHGDETIYKIEFVFPELPNTRTLTVKKHSESITLSFGEAPDAAAVIPVIEKLAASSGVGALALGMIERKLGTGFIEKKLHNLFEPEFEAPLAGSKSADGILAEENARIERERGEILSVPFISNFIRTEIRQSVQDKQEEETPKKRRGIIGLISGIFRARQKDYDGLDGDGEDSTDSD